MKAGNVKGALLEYLVRQILINCGFISVLSDNFYTYESDGLFYINGRGAAHDADVLMEPPIQIPFSYPSRILFECKANKSTIGLAPIRNALGLRVDINEFEVVTKSSLRKRQKNRRSEYAIENRKRFNYQVGVASVSDFKKPAIEFAANNKIYLLSLYWFFGQTIVDSFDSIDQRYIDNKDGLKDIYDYLKDRHIDDSYNNRHESAIKCLKDDRKIGRIITDFKEIINRLFVGVIESGEIIFLFAKDNTSAELLLKLNGTGDLRGQFHYYRKKPDYWYLTIQSSHEGNSPIELTFNLPKKIMRLWEEYRLDKKEAVHIKGEYFSRVWIFKKSQGTEFPFIIVNIDREWLNQIR